MTKVIYARVSEEVHERIQIMADQTGLKASQVVDALLRRALTLPDQPPAATASAVVGKLLDSGVQAA